MQKRKLVVFAIFIIVQASYTPAYALPLESSLREASNLPTPCIGNCPEVYLVIDGTRRHIVDWATFLSLGYQLPHIIPCGAAANFPGGQPVTQLINGSDADVYLVSYSVRRHIPDMSTFSAMGFQNSEITVLP